MKEKIGIKSVVTIVSLVTVYQYHTDKRNNAKQLALSSAERFAKISTLTSKMKRAAPSDKLDNLFVCVVQFKYVVVRIGGAIGKQHYGAVAMLQLRRVVYLTTYSLCLIACLTP